MIRKPGDNRLCTLKNATSTNDDYVNFLTTHLSLVHVSRQARPTYSLTVHVIKPDDLIGTCYKIQRNRFTKVYLSYIYQAFSLLSFYFSESILHLLLPINNLDILSVVTMCAVDAIHCVSWN